MITSTSNQQMKNLSLLIKKAKAKVEEQLEESLYRLGNNSGVIFNLKNNYGWKDNVEVTDKTQLTKVEELLSKIEEVFYEEDSDLEDLDIVSETIAERDYYQNTNK